MKFVCTLLLLAGITLEAQEYREKYNVVLQRVEYFNASGKLIGYSRENSRYNSLEFFDSTGVLVRSYSQSEILKSKSSAGLDSTIAGIRRWNYFRQRFDLFDSTGSVIGYYNYDTISNKWIYYLGR
jgi:hypothetical protein